MSIDIFGPMCDMPDGTTLNAEVANICVPAGERLNRAPIFNSVLRDNRAFLAWLRAFCPDGLTAQLKNEKLMVVTSTADRFPSRCQRTAVPRCRGGCDFPYLHAPREPLCETSGKEPE